jgi:tetratricopeptide (TPR) repeat protein
MLKSFQHEIQTILAPTWETTSLALMPNKPKNNLAKTGYKLAEDGSLRPAYSLFLDVWRQDMHVPSGYNAALILESLGDLSGAIDLMEDVCDYSRNSACYEQIGRMKEALTKQGQAEKQISGEESAGDQMVTKTQLITME